MTHVAEDPDTVNPDRAFQVAWIVYINGIEVPVSSVSISYGVWQIPQAEITMVPDPTLARLGAEDRVTVQVFYCDYWLHPDEPEFRLMFDGEIVAWSYVGVQKGRAISFSCVDYMQIFTQIFFFFMSSVDDIGIGASGQEIGVTINSINNSGYAPIYPYSLFAQGLTGAGSPRTDNTTGEGAGAGDEGLINRPIDFVYNVVRAMIGADTPNRSVPAANFFSPWTRRTKFHRRFLALPFLEDSDDPGVFPILRAVRANYAMSAVAQLASGIGSAGSIWQMLESILQTLMMEISMLPTPVAVLSNYATLEIRGPVHREYAGYVKPSSGTRPVMLGNYITKPQFLFGIPPTCNVFFPPQVSRLGYEENYSTQPTRMYFNEESWVNFLQIGQDSVSGLGAMLRDALAVAHPEEVNIASRAAIERPGENGKNILVYPEEFFKGPVVDRRPMPSWFSFLGQSQQQGETGDEAPEPTGDVAPGDTDRNVYRMYAKYEFFKERYARRSGAMSLAFNPYPVPGFPCAVFDRRSSQIDIFGYITSVRQNLSASGWATDVAYSYGRTFREMFDLMNRQFSMENTQVQEDQAETVSAVNRGAQASLSSRAELVGAIGTAPPEPIREIRDVIQNFTRAEQFYKTLFFRFPSERADFLSQEQLRVNANRQEQTTALPDQQPGEEPTQPALTFDQAQVDSDLHGRRAAFLYNEILDFIDDEGARENVSLQGIDATARATGLANIAKMREGTATPEEVQFVRRATSLPTVKNIPPGTADTATGQAINLILNTAEVIIRCDQVRSNISGDRGIVPKPEAEHLFKSYESGMQYNARPICTLDEYIAFLSPDGIRGGRVEPGVSLLHSDPRTFAAPYYTRIRVYEPGPPAEVPLTDVTNTSTVSTPDGINERSTGTSSDSSGRVEVQSLPEDFPQTRANWSRVLLGYRLRVLSDLPPRT